MESFFNGLQRFGIGRLTAILGAAGGVAAVLAMVILHVSAQPQSLLYSNLDLKEASQITQTLDQAGIKYEAKGDGSTIMVNRDEVAKARMMLASKGLPTAASVGYEIFDKAPTLGQTEFVQNLDNQRALEGELARTIDTLQGISSTRVHLVMPRRDLFSETQAQPTASVVVALSGGDLSAESVRAIRNLVAGAVPNLKPENVTLVDDRNHLLAAGGEGDDALDSAGMAEKNAVEDAMRKRVLDIVEGVVGRGAARVMVSADVDQSSTTQEQVEYNPDGQVVRSTSTNSNSESSSDPNAGGATTASANIPGTQQAPNIATTSGNNSKQDSEITNYEISTTKTTKVTGPGQIKKLAISVAVDDVAVPSKDGKSPPTYQKRSDADIQKIHDLVAAAVAAYEQPGDPDPVKVVNISFNHDVDDGEGTLVKKSLLDFTKNDIMRAAEMVVLLIVALLTVFLVARPLIKFIGTQPGYLVAANGGAQLAGPGGVQMAGAGALEGGQAGYPAIGAANQMVPAPAGDERIDIARIEGQVRVSSVKKVSEFVERHPDESVSILRSWLHDT
ncbi:flagellar basal-body MS-ring/collar protein FliF [Asticcacaulis sp. EMRT-3]|uniref:flagellar basal-body MS-ring/collar protein FliF n=1 Tax=Asticcacaulis sp. EMRT-3 TaxID=3040349 RepID=UPI0032C21F96